MKKFLIAFAILSLFLHCNAYAQKITLPGPDNGIILFMQGDVKVKSAVSEAWMNAEKGMVLSKGDNLKTGAESWAEIGFGKDLANSVRVQENTHVIFTDLGATKINLIQGELRSLVEKLSKNAIFEIKTPVSVCGVRGTGWDSITDGKTAETDVYENSVFFSGLSGQGSTIDSGKRGLLSGPAGVISIEDLPIDKINNWNRWKENFTERKAAEGVSSGSGGAAGQIGTIENQQEILEKMNKSKEAIFQGDEQKELDNRLDSERNTGGGHEIVYP